MDPESRQAHQGSSNQSTAGVEQPDSQYKSVNRLKDRDKRAPPKAKHKHGDPVTILINEDSDDADVIECTVYYPTLNHQSNQWEYQLADKDGTFLEKGKYFAEGSFVYDPTRKAVA